MTISKSPERGTFQKNKFVERQTEKGLMEDPITIKMLEFYKNHEQLMLEQEQDPEWQKNNLEYDLRTTDWILKKVRECDTYAQNLYAAMCNNEFVKNDVWPLLKEETWSCSWRHSGGIIADMREEGDYMDWYCSGIGRHEDNTSASEGYVSDEIREDLFKLGWITLSDED